jgi:transcriptional regulator with XRE-family HTH domain
MNSIQIIFMTKFGIMKTTRVGQILNRLMAEKKIRVAELARQINLPQPTIHRIAAGTCEHPHLSSLEPIANFFSISIDQLKGHEFIPWLDRASKIPLITWEHILSLHSNTKEDCQNELIFTDANVGKNGYALKMNDASMDPVFPKNTLLIADPDRLPKDRSYVVAKLASMEIPVFRQMLINVKDRYLKALSPDFEQYKMIHLTNDDQILSVIVQAKRDYED